MQDKTPVEQQQAVKFFFAKGQKYIPVHSTESAVQTTTASRPTNRSPDFQSCEGK